MWLLTSTDQKSPKMLSSQPAGWWASKSGREAFGAIRCFDLDAEGAQDVDAEVCAGFLVLRVVGHGGCDFGVDEPVAALDVVIVTAGAYTLDQEGLDFFDPGEGSDGVGGGHVGESLVV
jgi:hypothetical protein